MSDQITLKVLIGNQEVAMASFGDVICGNGKMLSRIIHTTSKGEHITYEVKYRRGETITAYEGPDIIMAILAYNDITKGKG